MSLKLLRISVSVPFAILDCASVVTPNTSTRNPCTPDAFLALVGDQLKDVEIHELPQFFGDWGVKMLHKDPNFKGLGGGGQDGRIKPTFAKNIIRLPRPHNKGSHTIMLVIVISPHRCAYSG